MKDFDGVYIYICSLHNHSLLAVVFTLSVGTARERIKSLSESGIGNFNWSLIDQNNKRRTYTEFRGQWLMIYFGFCHCPDICPEELEKLVDVVKGIGK